MIRPIVLVALTLVLVEPVSGQDTVHAGGAISTAVEAIIPDPKPDLLVMDFQTKDSGLDSLQRSSIVHGLGAVQGTVDDEISCRPWPDPVDGPGRRCNLPEGTVLVQVFRPVIRAGSAIVNLTVDQSGSDELHRIWYEVVLAFHDGDWRVEEVKVRGAS